MVLPSAKLRERNVEDFNIENWFNDFLNLLSVEQTVFNRTAKKTLGHRENETSSKWTFFTDPVLMTESPAAKSQSSIEAASFRLKTTAVA